MEGQVKYMRKRKLLKVTSIFLCISMLMSPIEYIKAADSLSAASDNSVNKVNKVIDKEYNNGINCYETRVKGYCATSFIHETEDGMETAEYYDGKLYVQYLDKEYNLLNSTEVNLELPKWGGMYFGDEYNYVVMGKNKDNKSEHGGETYRITKYDKMFNEVDRLSVYSEESYTSIPFDNGNVSMALQDNILLVYTCRKRLDGHQSNICFKIDTKDMKIINQNGMSQFPVIHVSHSLGQKIAFDKDDVLYADVSDGVPIRSVYYNNLKISGAALAIPGEYGAGLTYTELNGIGVTDKYYLFTGMTQKNNANNAYLVSVNKETNKADINWLTNSSCLKYEAVAGLKMVQLSENKFVVMWQSGRRKVTYCIVDNMGNRLSNNKVVNVKGLSDCQPIYYDNAVAWNYVEDGKLSIEKIDDFSEDKEISSQEQPVYSDEYWDGTTDVSWYESDKSEFEIDTPEKLAGLAQMVNNGNDFSGKRIVLVNDIFMNSANYSNIWIPIGLNNNSNLDIQFNGIFDGNGNAIYNIYEDGSVLGGLFGKVGENGMLINIDIKQGKLCSGGAFADTNYGIIAYCDNYSYICDIGETSAIGGICNKNYNYVYGCTNYGIVVGRTTAGITGKNLDNMAVVSQCSNKGNVAATGDAYGIAYMNHAWIYNCYNTGVVSNTFIGGHVCVPPLVFINAAKEVEGIVGSIGQFNHVENCYFAGTLSYTEDCWYGKGPITKQKDESLYNCYSYLYDADNSTTVSLGMITSNYMIRRLDRRKRTMLSAWKDDVEGINEGMPITMADYNRTINKFKYQPEIWMNGEGDDERNVKVGKELKINFYYNEKMPEVAIEDNDIAKATVTKEECILKANKNGKTKVSIILPEGDYCSGEELEFELCVNGGEKEDITSEKETETEETTTDAGEETTKSTEEMTSGDSENKTISLNKCDISLSKTSYVYDGKIKKPAVKVRYRTRTLKAGKDYTIYYKNNKNAGNAKVIIKALEGGSCKGKVTKEFNINKAEPMLIVSDKYIKLKEGESDVYIKSRTNSEGKLSYKSSKSRVAIVDKKGKIIPKRAGSCTITVMVSESKNYISKKATVKVKVNQLKKQNIKCEKKITKTYGDGKFSLNIKVKDGAKVTYTSSNTSVVTVSKDGVVNINNSGEAIINVRVSGTSVYKQTNKHITVNIKKTSIKKVRVILRKGNIGFNTFDKEKDIKVMYGNKLLKYDKDYYFSAVYRTGIMNGELGTLRVEIEGVGNYTGIKSVTLI